LDAVSYHERRVRYYGGRSAGQEGVLVCLRYAFAIAMAGSLAGASALGAQRGAGPDLAGTWILDVGKSWETGRDLKFDTTMFARSGSTYRVAINFDHGRGPHVYTKIWPAGSGDSRATNSDGQLEHVITRVDGDTVSYIDELVIDGQPVNLVTGRTWLSKDRRMRTDEFEIADVQGEPLRASLVFNRK
jgi:hypothetical protein